MNAPGTQPPKPHETVLLLPWYLNRTLAEEERRSVEEHLLVCGGCRAELESTVASRGQLRAAWDQLPVPAASLRDRVMSQVRQEGVASAGKTRRAPSPMQTLSEFLQRLMQPTWVPTAALAVILLQAGAITWLVQPQAPEINTRGVGPVAAARIRVVFNPHATMGEIREGLVALGGFIVDGPGLDGAYVVQLPPESPAEISRRLRELRERPGLVERIENVP